MRTITKLPTSLASGIALACFALSACTGETEADTEIVSEETETVGIEAPGLQTIPEDNGGKSADSDQPRIGAGSVSAELGSPVAEPGQPIEGDQAVRGNQGAANE